MQDVYENEGSYFFHDCSDQVIRDDTLSRILTLPNVVVTSHQVCMDRALATCLSA